MIPDFVDLRKELEEEALLYINLRRQASSPVLEMMRTSRQHEGLSHSYVQDGIGVVEGTYEKIEQKVEVSFMELPNLVDDALRKKLDEIADETAKQMSEMFFRRFTEETTKVGNNFDAGGQELSQDLFLEMVSRVEMTFDENKRPEHTLVMHPEMAKSFLPRAAEWEKDPKFSRRHQEILAEKYEAFRARESNRKLVS